MSLPTTLPVMDGARNKILSVLANPTTGFNPQFAQTITQSPYAGAVNPVTVDFSGSTRSFIMEKVEINDYLSMNPNVNFPIFVLWGESALPIKYGMNKHSVFSGSCLLYLDMHISIPEQTFPSKMHLATDAYLSTLFTVLNYPGGPNESTLSAGPVYWLNELAVRGRTFARSNSGLGWLQTISTSMTMKIQY